MFWVVGSGQGGTWARLRPYHRYKHPTSRPLPGLLHHTFPSADILENKWRQNHGPFRAGIEMGSP